ncbi:hypothetical protein SAMN05421788_10295 [Filimonas lacunae]|uniref:Uncharacterized protein n=1 Tax=Filimonas lacunae TaxID=477680 RepID=A0A173MIN7_9BACT|nr:hypothetical protein [Filimonas lacunae]BAV07281.1 hypothetical protein FLA_3304 [Filimonas lacunae]SIS92077.1 hypothetical protein SAMN05421788_10295 [Filimonas lacunae]
MQQNKLIKGESVSEIWQQIKADFTADEALTDYHVVINQDGKDIQLDINIDYGGGFEGGYELTTLTSIIHDTPFRFAIHPQNFLYEIGKLFGIQDVTIGYPDFDKKVVVKTNDEEEVKALFADKSIRETYQDMDDYVLSVTENEYNQVILELEIQRGITDAAELQQLYTSFYKMLDLLDAHALV